MIGLLTLFWEAVAMYGEAQVKYTNMFSGQNADVFNSIAEPG
jgi:hypothetical protein